MKCANCAKDNPVGARYCVHCGAEQSLPTPIAAVAAAAMALRARKPAVQAANAAHAEPLPSKPLPSMAEPVSAPSYRQAFDRPDAARDDAADTEVAANAPQPAYASAPPRTGVAAALIVACVAVAVLAFAGWRMLQSESPRTADAANRDPGESVMSAFPPEATPLNPRRAARDAAAPQATQESTPAPGAESPSPNIAAAGEGGSSPSASPAPPPVEIRALPTKPAQRTTRRAAPETAPAPQPVAPSTSVAPPPVVAAAPKASPAPMADRWVRMRDELSRCTREDFISRVVCDQRVRFRYCGSYWGKVPECPGSPVPDHGQ